MRRDFSRSLATPLVLSSIMGSSCVSFTPRPIDPEKSAAAFDSRTLDDRELKTFLDANRSSPTTAWPLSTWDFESLTLVAFYFHPALELARAEWRSASAAIETAGARPNPSVGVTPGYSFNSAAGVSPWLPILSFDIPIETAGKRDLRMERARALSDAARLRIAAAAWRVRSNVRGALIKLTESEGHAGKLSELAHLQHELADRLDARYRAGMISSFELLNARLGLQQTELDAAEAQRLRSEDLVRLADSIGLPATALAGRRFELGARAPLESELTSAAIRQTALTSRTDILAALAEYVAAERALELEIAKQYPDVHLGTGYQFDQGEHKWSLGLTIELPLLNRNEGAINEAKARRLESATRFEALQAQVLGEIDLAVATYENARARFADSTAVVAARESQTDAVHRQLAAGASDQLEVLAAEMEKAQAGLVHLEAERHLVEALGALEDGVQRPLAGRLPSTLDSPPTSESKDSP